MGTATEAQGLQRLLAEAARSKSAAARRRRLDEALSALLAEPADAPWLAEFALGDLATLTDHLIEALDGHEPLDDPAARRRAWDLLDRLRRTPVARRLAAEDVDGWAARELALVERSHLTLGPLFRQRATDYAYKTLFEVPRGEESRSISWLQAASRVEFLARGLFSLDRSESPAPLAILSENSIDMALIDLACLTSGIVDVMIPATATGEDVAFMLRQSGCGTLVVAGGAQLRKVQPFLAGLEALRHVIVIGDARELPRGAIGIDELMARAAQVPASVVTHRSEATPIDALATIMYTSGTTGQPKGIRFTQRNLVYKRFARGLALPEIGDGDVFVCFLPLYHTFGRFLELVGCVFWGATYCFVDNPSQESLSTAMRRHQASVFISVPKKWIQLYEAIARRADPWSASEAELERATREVVGDRLRWGLSAAGHLDGDIFRFFQRQGIELMSGFGMTEATGGITMTPPGSYEEDSLGLPLPGISCRLADDGEMLVRGPYVMDDYVAPPEGEAGFDADGWFHTGDLMEQNADGHYRIVDRKKEIYKNVKGETIAPQRIENLFRDFASVGRAFLVGDHKEYNTLLIWPDPNYDELDFASMAPSEVREHFRSLVVAVNEFLAPYERIVDFALIDRDLEEARGELTKKGTPRRKTIADNFSETIRALYRRVDLQLGEVRLVVPNWLLQTTGLTTQDLHVEGERLRLRQRGTSLVVHALEDGRTRIGDFVYRHPPGPLNLGVLLTTPRLWLGNGELVDLVALSSAARRRTGRSRHGIVWDGYARHQRPQPRGAQSAPGELMRVDRAARHLASGLAAIEAEAIDELALVVAEGKEPIADAARTVLARTARSRLGTTARHGFRALAPLERDARFAETLEAFLAGGHELFDTETIEALEQRGLSDAKLEVLIALALDSDTGLAATLLRTIAFYAAGHPTTYKRARTLLTRVALAPEDGPLQEEARQLYRQMRAGFRKWLGPNSSIAVDPENRREYRWADVVAFDNDVPQVDRSRIVRAMSRSPMLREAIFLFTDGYLIRLSDLPAESVQVRRMGSRHGKSVYRLSVQTRFHGSFELAVHLNRSLPRKRVVEEIRLLILCGDPGAPAPLVEEFGGHYPDHALWTEEYITGETLDRALARLSRVDAAREGLVELWPFLAMSALSAYFDFWNRSGRRWQMSGGGTSDIIVPTQDYQTGARLVSLHDRVPHRSLGAMLRDYKRGFVDAVAAEYPELGERADWRLIFAALLEIVGEEEGMQLLQQALVDAGVDEDPSLREDFEDFRARVREKGFLPLRLFSAAKRFQRWDALSAGATRTARARTLQELYDTYGLQRLAGRYPEVRARFFRETVFRDAPGPLAEALEGLIGRLRERALAPEDVIDAVAELRSRTELGEDDDYFLARISFPHLRPEDATDFVSQKLGGRSQSEVVVAFEDREGQLFRVRHALNPKEVERLHRIFLAAKLDVRFRPEHQYLVVINERGQLVGGIYYEVDHEHGTAHLEKIAVADPHRKKGVAEGLMNEFFNRLRAQGIAAVTTGFFRPEYFHGFGFRIEQRFAGLVKELGDGVE